MSEYPSWSDERNAYADANWSGGPQPVPPPAHFGGGGNGYPGADPYANRGGGAGGYAGYDNRGAAGYGGAAGGGGGGGGGFGGGFTGGYGNKPAGAAKASEISYDTSSRDPAHLRARVFIGCLGQSGVVREDIIELCRPFGPLMAVTLFKGYAFVQYEQAEDADNSCEVLNGKRWKGVNVDVHLAMEGLVRKTLPQKRGADGSPAGRGGRGGGMGGRGGGGGGRGGGGGGSGGGGFGGGAAAESVNDWQGQAAKRPRVGMSSALTSEDAYTDINEQNKKNAAADSGVPEMIGTEMADTLICGTCRYVTSDFVAFREHRKKQCVKPKEATEPPVLRCASCGLRFLSAWKMLFHLTDFHRMQLFKPDFSEEALERAKFEDDKYKNVSTTRMQAWKEEQETDKSTFTVDEPVGVPPPPPPPPPASGDNASIPLPPAAAKSGGEAARSFASDEAIDTFGAGDAGATNGNGDGAPKERVTTGADYDEDEEDDEDDGKPLAIPSLG